MRANTDWRRNNCSQVSVATAAAAEALWRCYKDACTTPDLSVPTRSSDDAMTREDATVLEDVLCGLRQQQLFQLHLLRQLQRQIDQLVVTGVLLGSRQLPQSSVACSTLLTPAVPASGFSSRPAPTAVASGASSPYHVMQSSPPASTMTSHLSPMSAMIDMSRKQLDQHADYTRTPSTDGQCSHRIKRLARN